MTVDEAVSPSCSSWRREQDKAFENALATHFKDSSDWWEKVASDVLGKTQEEIKLHYELLVEDVDKIESGRVPLRSYNSSSSDGSTSNLGEQESGKKGGGSGNVNGESNQGGKGSRSDQERRKGIAWTEEEHSDLQIPLQGGCSIKLRRLLIPHQASKQEGCSIEELNAGRVCDWFLKDKLA
ncbi:uncharacterized protein J3R85_001403 [Psidium guajava]|nr:uncharacterized protein J3R85_001403 [Psidium guajava]